MPPSLRCFAETDSSLWLSISKQCFVVIAVSKLPLRESLSQGREYELYFSSVSLLECHSAQWLSLNLTDSSRARCLYTLCLFTWTLERFLSLTLCRWVTCAILKWLKQKSLNWQFSCSKLSPHYPYVKILSAAIKENQRSIFHFSLDNFSHFSSCLMTATESSYC